MNNGKYEVALNFLPLTIQEFSFSVYRKKYEGENKEDGFESCHKYSLPINPNLEKNKQNRAEYWISFAVRDGFELFKVDHDHNRYLTQWFLYHQLLNKCKSTLESSNYIVPGKFREVIGFVINTHPEGAEIIYLEPFYLGSASKLGFLIDYSFKKNPDVPFSKKVQQLSLSLDRSFRKNKNFYIDRYEKLQLFFSLYFERLFPISSGFEIGVTQSLFKMPAKKLDIKRYIFAENQEDNSQFQGVKKYGPFEKPTNNNLKFYFIYRNQDRGFAVDLLKALKGESFPSTFSGMTSMFKIPFNNDNIIGKALESFSEKNLQAILDEIKLLENEVVIPIIHILSKDDPESQKVYYLAKYLFIKNKIPLQFVTLNTLRSKDSLKWSVSNLGLQIFSKLGGSPWKVKPRSEKCLIIGIGQCHELSSSADGKNKITKYHAYSVLTDSSGLYLDLEVLSKTEEREEYLKELRMNLRTIILNKKSEFNKIVIHTPFKISYDELRAIKSMLEEFREEDIDFVVLKINTSNKYFGYHFDVSSYVPYESTYIQLSWKEYLVWFEGLQYHNPNVHKQFSGPTHIEFFFESRMLSEEERTAYLQDTINLSGANWRGFNAKSLPVSVYYCELVADFIKEFNAFGYKDYQIDNLSPWFL